jgi:hypothetical protein
MNNIKLSKIFLFILVLSIFYNLFFSNMSFIVPHFSTSFKPINGYLWESSELNFLLLIKLYAIYLISNIKNYTIVHALLHVFGLELLLLTIFKKSSLIIHGIISIIFFNILKKKLNNTKKH